MATTTNYGWTTPDDTALVKDGAAAIRTLGSSVDTTTKNLNPETTLGDIAYRSSTANVKTRLGIGSTGQVLTVASGVPSWATPAGAASGPAFYVSRITSDQTTTFDVLTKVAFNGETFDTDNCFDSTTNYRFTPNKAGYYQLNFSILFTGTSGNAGEALFRKNNTTNFSSCYDTRTGGAVTLTNSMIMYLDGSTDYVEVYLVAYTSDGTIKANAVNTSFSGVWIRS